MDILHPAFVHFPIGLLSLYTLLESLSILKFMRKKLHTAKILLLGFGVIATFLTRLTGEHDEDYFIHETPALEMHEELSFFVVVFFGALICVYILEWLIATKKIKSNMLFSIATSQYVKIILAVMGFGILTTVGALGGSLVHGADADPMIRFITNLLGVS